MAPHIHFPAILAAALSMFLLGGLWYSPILFVKPWMRANGFTDEYLSANGSSGRIYGGAFVLVVIAAVNLAFFLGGPETTIAWGATAGALTGVWIVAALGVLYLFERRPMALFVINGGYNLVSFTLMGLIIGAWR